MEEQVVRPHGDRSHNTWTGTISPTLTRPPKENVALLLQFFSVTMILNN